MKTVNISLTDSQHALVDALVKKLDYANRSEFFRMLIKKMKANPYVFLEPEPIRLSDAADKRYAQMIDEIESGKVKTFSTNNVDELIAHLKLDEYED